MLAGVVGGLIAWLIIASIGNLLFRMFWPGYAAVEAAMTFTLAMLLGRLVLGAVSSLGAGFAAAWITKGNTRIITVLGILLTVLFLPLHYNLWEKFPVWYHLLFLATLFPFTLLGASLWSRRGGSVPPA
jgi:hypothetical protein